MLGYVLTPCSFDSNKLYWFKSNARSLSLHSLGTERTWTTCETVCAYVHQSGLNVHLRNLSPRFTGFMLNVFNRSGGFIWTQLRYFLYSSVSFRRPQTPTRQNNQHECGQISWYCWIILLCTACRQADTVVDTLNGIHTNNVEQVVDVSPAEPPILFWPLSRCCNNHATTYSICRDLTRRSLIRQLQC